VLILLILGYAGFYGALAAVLGAQLGVGAPLTALLLIIPATVPAWIWWSLSVPKWRLWAMQNVDDWPSLKRAAVEAMLIFGRMAASLVEPKSNRGRMPSGNANSNWSGQHGSDQYPCRFAMAGDNDFLLLRFTQEVREARLGGR
jgi:hypothetical protein